MSLPGLHAPLLTRYSCSAGAPSTSSSSRSFVALRCSAASSSSSRGGGGGGATDDFLRGFQKVQVRSYLQGFQQGGKHRFKTIRKRALETHIDYVRQLGPKLNFTDRVVPDGARTGSGGLPQQHLATVGNPGRPSMNRADPDAYDPVLKTPKWRHGARFGSPNTAALAVGGDVWRNVTPVDGGTLGRTGVDDPAPNSAGAGHQQLQIGGGAQGSSLNLFQRALDKPHFSGFAAGLELPGYGTIEVYHGDVFDFDRNLSSASALSNKDPETLLGSDAEALRVERQERLFSPFDNPAYQEFFDSLTPATQQRMGLEELSGSSSNTSTGSSNSTAPRPSGRRAPGTHVTLLAPMIPNFLPFRGYSLEVLERGGEAFVKEAFEETRRMLDIQNAAAGELDASSTGVGTGVVGEGYVDSGAGRTGPEHISMKRTQSLSNVL